MPRSQSEIEPRQRGRPQKRRLKKFSSEILQTSNNDRGSDNDNLGGDIEAKRICSEQHAN